MEEKISVELTRRNWKILRAILEPIIENSGYNQDLHEIWCEIKFASMEMKEKLKIDFKAGDSNDDS